MCQDVTLQPYNMAKQLQPPPVDYLLYIRESRGIQNFVIADKMELLESPVSDDESGYGNGILEKHMTMSILVTFKIHN